MSNSFIGCVASAQRSLLAHAAVTTGFDTMDDEALREAVAVLETLSHSAQAIQADVIAEISVRARRHDDAEAARVGYYGPHCTEEFVVDELALLLSSTRQAASHRYDRAVRTARSASVMAAWRSGQIDGRKAESIAHSYAVCGETLESDQLDRLIDASLQYATGHTAPQLREWLRRRQIAADPAAAERRRQIAQGERRVMIRHLDDGVSELWALLPTVSARMIQQILDQVARESRASGSDDLMDNRRADALVELLTGEIDPPPASVQVVVPVEVLTGTSDEPAWIPGVGPITAPEARSLAGPATDGTHRAVFRRLLTDPTTGVLTDIAEQQYRPSARLERAVRARDLTCRFPGCRRPALGNSTGTDVDHTVPWPQGSTTASNLAVLCRRHHRLKHTPGWDVVLHPDGTMTWTTPTGRTHSSEPWKYTDPEHNTRGQPPPQLE